MGSGGLDLAVEMGRQAVLVALKISLPILLAGLLVGGILSVLQAATQIQESTLSSVPKMLAIAAMVFILMPWLLGVLVEYTTELVHDMATWFR